MAKKAKKFALSRNDLSEQIRQLVDDLRNIDTFESSPSDVSEQLGEVADQLDDLEDRLTEEA